MKRIPPRPVTDEALLDAAEPVRRRIPIPNPALARYLQELDDLRPALKKRAEQFRLANDALEFGLHRVPFVWSADFIERMRALGVKP